LFGGPLGSVVLPVEGERRSTVSTSILGDGIVASVAGFAALLTTLPGEGTHRFHLPEAG